MKAEKGFTLIEIMITIAIVAVIGAAIYNAYFSSVRSWNYNKSKMEIQRAQDLSDRWISQYARKAEFINWKYSNNKDLTDGQKLYLEYVDNNGVEQKVSFGREDYVNPDYLYFYKINDDGDIESRNKIGNLKFNSLSFNYNNNMIIMNAEIINNNENNPYIFTSYFSPRLVDITTP